MKILIIEDNRNLAQSLARALKLEKYSTEICQNGQDGYEYWMEHNKNIDLVILDEMLPGKSGFAIIRDIRIRGIPTPTIMLTAKTRLADKVEGLKSGCDDYITKPFELDEIFARIEAVFRRPKETKKTPFDKLPSNVRLGALRDHDLVDIIGAAIMKDKVKNTTTYKVKVSEEDVGFNLTYSAGGTLLATVEADENSCESNR